MEFPMPLVDAYEALRMCVQYLGGNKVVGAAMRPELSPDKAAHWLAHCLNPNKRDKLTPPQIQWIQRMANQCGHHIGNETWVEGIGYRLGAPITPEAEIAQLKKEATQAAEQARKASDELFARMRAAGLKVEDDL